MRGIRDHRFLFVLLLGVVIAITGCATVPSPTQQGAIGGAALGAVVGQAIGEDTESTVLGAATGAAAGALIGEQVEIRRERQAVAAAQEEAIRQQQAEIARLRRERETAAPAVVRPRPQAGREVALLEDPTQGVFVNSTRWLVKIFVDRTDLQGRPDLTLNPNEERPETLDVGAHRIYATAYVHTSKGLRRVGNYDGVVEVDVRGRGWSLTFEENSFQ